MLAENWGLRLCVDTLQAAQVAGIGWVLDAPANSYVWEQTCVPGLVARARVCEADWCMLGGDGDRRVRFATSKVDLTDVARTCDRLHQQAAWGSRRRTSILHTALEYPAPLSWRTRRPRRPARLGLPLIDPVARQGRLSPPAPPSSA